MKFNPLFIQNTNQSIGNSGTKPSKLNSPSYLFSDIIRLLNDSSAKQGVPVTPGPGQKLTAGNDTSIKKGVNDPINIISSDADLGAFLENLFNTLGGNELVVKGAGTSGIDADALNKASQSDNKGAQLSNEIINLLKNKDSLTLNINLLNDSALNFNDKQQLVSKVFNSDAGTDGNPESQPKDNNNLLNKELEKIASLIFGLINQQKTAADIQGNYNADTKAAGISPDVKATVQSMLSADKPVTLNFNIGDEKLKIEIAGNTGMVEQGQNNLPDEIIMKAAEKTQNKTALNNIVPENPGKAGIENSLKNIKQPVIDQNVDVKVKTALDSSVKNNNLKPEVKTEQVNSEQGQKFIVKVTTGSVEKHSQDTNAIKDMLQKLGASEKDGIKIITTDTKPVVRPDGVKAEKPVQAEKNIVSAAGNDIKGTVKAVQVDSNFITAAGSDIKETVKPAMELPVSQSLKSDEVVNTVEKNTGSVVETVDNLTGKTQKSKNDIKNLNAVPEKSGADTVSRQTVADIAATPDKDFDGKQPDDNKELFSSRLTSVSQGASSGPAAIKNEAAHNILNLHGDNSLPVKAENLMSEITRFFEQGESKSVVLKLKPETLGKVKIVLDVVDKVVHANIQVDSEAVKQVVQNNINALRQTLNLSGLQLSSFNVSLNNGESRESKSYSNKKKSNHSGFSSKITGENELVSTKSMGYNTYDFLA